MKRFIAKISKSFKGGQKGFTLIELLIVIVILGVLAAAIIPNLSKFLGSGQLGSANAELASVRTAINAAMADNNGTAPTGSGTIAGGDGLKVYITGSAGIRGLYSWGADGVITGATNGPGSTGATAWPTTVKWDATTLQWVKGP